MKSLRKIGALLLSFTIIGTSFMGVACSKSDEKSGNVEVISKDSPWFDAKTVDLTKDIDKSELDNLWVQYTATTDDGYLFIAQGQKHMPDDFDWEKDDYNKYAVNTLMLIDNNGNKLKEASLSDIAIKEKVDFYYCNYDQDGVFKAYFYKWDEKKQESKYYEAKVDTKTLEVSKLEKTDDLDDKYYSAPSDASREGYFEGQEDINGYNIKRYWLDLGGTSTYRLVITDPKGKETELKMADVLPGVTIYDMSSMYASGDDTVLIMGNGEEGQLYLELSLDDCSITQLKESETKWMEDVELYNLQTIKGNAYSITDTGVTKVDFKKKSAEEIFTFADSNFNRYNRYSSQLIDVADGQVVFYGTGYEDGSEYMPMQQAYLYIFTKADSNPNAGKEVIKVCCLDGNGQDYYTCDAVCHFNETSDKYFIKYDDRYQITDDMWQEIANDGSMNNSDDWERATMNLESKISDKLAIDLINGDGPDIILGGFNYGQLNNESYLLDLSDYMKDLGGDYFTNIIDCVKTGDALYQIPVTFSMYGIVTMKKYVKDGQNGFTFDDYKKFVKDTCNGEDPISTGKAMYFITCMNASSDLFFDGNGNVDFNNNAFKELAKYCKDNVNDPADWDESEPMTYNEDDWQPPVATLMSISGFSAYVENYYWAEDFVPEDRVILGIPSYDARGPVMTCNISAAISAQTPNADGCWEFIKYLLSEQVQEDYGRSYNIPLNVTAFEKSAKAIVDNRNKAVGDENGMSYSYYSMMPKLSDSHIELFRDIILSCSGAYSTDPEIGIIVSEELPAYFEGQKSLDDVINIAEDRVQKVVNERR